MERLEHDSPTWYRLRINELNVRIVFSLWQHRGEKWIEYRVDEAIWDDCPNRIDIEMAGYRDENTYREARRRWRKSRGN